MPRSLPLLLVLLASALGGQQPTVRPPGAMPPPGPPAATAPEPGSELTVSLLTMGPGDEIWEKFGHNAIRVRDARLGTDVAYNWGVFDFRQPHFIPRFLQGQMLYSMYGFTMESTMLEYQRLDRTVLEQQLDLPPRLRAELRDILEWNALPEHRDYRYDYYRDNCSTRPRDVIDRLLRGALRAATFDRSSGHSYRWQTMRLVQDGPLLATGMDIGLGRPADHVMTQWEEMFLPMKLHDHVGALTVTDADGRRHPLVGASRVLYQSRTHAEAADAPHWWPIYLVLGIALGALFAWLGVRAVGGSRRARIWGSVLFSLFAFVAGVLGVLLAALWAMTDHVFAHRNENLLLFNPLWLVLAVLAPLTAVRGSMALVTRRIAALLAILAAAALALHLVGLSREANLPIIALALPPILALAWAETRGTR